MKIILISLLMIVVHVLALPESPACPINYILYSDGYCYGILVTEANYLDAEALCAAEGGMIAHILDKNNLEFITINLLTSFSTNLESRFHIGLRMLSYMNVTLSSCLPLGNFKAWNFISSERNFTSLKRCMSFTLEKPEEWEAINCQITKAFPICMKTRNFPCPAGFTFYYNRCYKFVDDKISMPDAKTACGQLYSNLVDFSCQDIQSFLDRFLNHMPVPPDRVHIGLTIWDNTTMTYVDNTTIPNWQSFPWDVNEPNAVTGKVACTSLTRDTISLKYKLRNNDCTERYSYICEIKTTAISICPPNTINIRGNCYYVTMLDSRWETAKLYCDAYGGQLAMLKNAFTHSMIADRLKIQFASKSLYFGMFYYDHTWKHVDGTNASYPEWQLCDACTNPDTTSARCAIVVPTSAAKGPSPSNKWKSVDCDALYSGICIWTGCVPTASNFYSKPYLQWSVNFANYLKSKLEISCLPPFVLSANNTIGTIGQSVLLTCDKNSAQWIPAIDPQCILPGWFTV